MGGGRGLVRILFLASDGTVRRTQDVRNPESLEGDGSSADGDSFGESIAALRDVNADGVPDLGVGAYRDDDGARDTGAFWVLYLNDDGTVQASQKISATTGGFTGPIESGDQFGWAAAAIDDVNRDGRPDVVVGAPTAAGTGASQGAVWILFGNDDLLPQGTPGLPYVEGFETNGLGNRYLAPGRFDGGSNAYFRRVVGDFTYSGSIPGSIDGPAYEGYVNFEGDRLWAGENVDGGNSDGSGEKTLTLQAVDVSGAGAVRFTGRFGATYNEVLGSQFDNVDRDAAQLGEEDITVDSLVVRYKVDGQPNFQPGLKFSPVPDDSDFNLNVQNPLAEDADFDGIGDGRLLTPELQDFSVDIPLPAGAQTLTVQIGVYTAESSEETAFDDLRLDAIDASFVAVASPLPNQEVAAGRSKTIDLAGVFQDADGETLSYTATSSDESVATASTSDGFETLTVTGAAEGTTTIEVTATNGSGASATDAFDLVVGPGPPTVDVDVRLAKAADVCDPTIAGDCDSVVLPELVNGAARSDSVTIDPGAPVLVSTVLTNNDARDVVSFRLTDEAPGYDQAFTTTIAPNATEVINRLVDAPLTPQLLTSQVTATVATADGEQTARADLYGINVPRPQVLADVRIARPEDIDACSLDDLTSCTVPDPAPQDPLVPRDTVEVGALESVVVTYAVTNVGETTLDRYTVVDDLQGGSIPAGPALAPGETYEVTQLYSAPTSLGVSISAMRVEAVDAAGTVARDGDTYGIDVLRPEVDLDVRLALPATLSGCDPSAPSTCTVPATNERGDPRSDTLDVEAGQEVAVTYAVTNRGRAAIRSLDVDDDLAGAVLDGEAVDIQPGATATFPRIRSAPTTPSLQPNLSPTFATGRDAGGNASRPDPDVYAFNVGVPDLDLDVRIARLADATGCDGSDLSDPDCTVPATDGSGDPRADTLRIEPGEAVLVTYDVTNIGATPLTNLQIDDELGGTFSSALPAELGVGETVVTTRLYTAPTATGLALFLALVTGTDAEDNATGDGDLYGLDVPAPQVHIDVRVARPATVSGCDVTDLSTCTVPDPAPQDPVVPRDTVEAGGQAEVVVTYAVTNTGPNPLVSYTVSDDRDATPVATGTDLAPGGTETVTLLRTAPSALGVSIAAGQVEATDAGGNVGRDADVYGIDVVRPQILLNVAVGRASTFCASGNLANAGCTVDTLLSDGTTPRPDTVTALPDGDAYLAEYYVTNTGVSPLTFLQIDDEGVVRTKTGPLAPGETTSLKRLGTASSSPGLETYRVVATATDGSGRSSARWIGARETYGVQTQGAAFRLFTQVAPAVFFCTDPADPSTCSTERLKRMKANPAKAYALLAKTGSDREVVRYRFFNTGTEPFERHTLVDNVVGTVFADRAETVGGLDSLVVFEIYDEVPLIGEERSSTWTAQLAGGEVLTQTSSEQPLPVELAGFDATVDGKAVTLTWATVSEENNAGFEVQRFDATRGAWIGLDFVEGAGTTTDAKRYRYEVGVMEPDVYRFRLRQIDAGGRFAVSPEVEALVNIDGPYRLTKPSPHPVRTAARITLTTREAQTVRVEMYDLLGRRVATVFEGDLEAGRKREIALRTDRLASGTYFLRAVGRDFAATERVVVVR